MHYSQIFNFKNRLIPKIFIITIDTAAEEKSVSLENLHTFEFFPRNGAEVRYAYEPGKAGPKIEPYRTVTSTMSQSIYLPGNSKWSGKIYFSADIPTTIEIEAWVEAF